MKLIKYLHRVRCLWWKIRKPVTKGARAILIKDKQVLLVQHSYTGGWYIPGGKIKALESYEEGLRRELREEVGFKSGDLTYFGTYENFYEGKGDTILVFTCHNYQMETNKNLEVKCQAYFDLDRLPPNISPGSLRRIQAYKEKLQEAYGQW